MARALALLDALSESDGDLRVGELARRIGVNASTASRLLATLERGELVERTASGSYRLGLKLVTLSDHVLARLDVRELGRPWLEWLVAQKGETATLSVPGGSEAITVDFVPSASSVVSLARVGRPSVPHATAAGKVMLAFAGSGTQPSPGAQLESFTDRTITDPRALAEELKRVRDSGIAEAIGEREPDLGALAAPVLGRSDELVAILGVQAPVARLHAEKLRSARSPLRRAAEELSRSLGGRGLRAP